MNVKPRYGKNVVKNNQPPVDPSDEIHEGGKEGAMLGAAVGGLGAPALLGVLGGEEVTPEMLAIAGAGGTLAGGIKGYHTGVDNATTNLAIRNARKERFYEAVEFKIDRLLEEAREPDIVPLHGYVGSFVWSDDVRKNLDPSGIWQVQHANEHNPHDNRKTGMPADEKSINKLNDFLTRYRN